MSLSCTEDEAMDRDELIDAIIGLSQSVEDIDAEIDALRDRYDRRTSGFMKTVSNLQDRIDELEDEVDTPEAGVPAAPAVCSMDTHSSGN